jgi:chromatin remodeling complex protein RSC6
MPTAKSSAKSASKTSQKTTTPVVTQETTAPVTKSTKQTKATKKETVPVSEITTTTTTTTTTVPEVSNVVVKSDATEVSLADGFTEFIGKFQALMSQFSSLKTELKFLEKRTIKQVKVVQKLNKKKGKKGPRAPSGFVKPSPISDELASFLGKEKGSEMARTDVTREINKYIRANNLQDKDNGRQINPDKQLQKLLKIDGEVILTYFNLQRYMGPHFPKSAKAEAAAAAAAAATAVAVQ